MQIVTGQPLAVSGLLCHPLPCPALLLQVRREVQLIVSRNKWRKEGTSAYSVLNTQPTEKKAGKERLQVHASLGQWQWQQSGVGEGCMQP